MCRFNFLLMPGGREVGPRGYRHFNTLAKPMKLLPTKITLAIILSLLLIHSSAEDFCVFEAI